MTAMEKLYHQVVICVCVGGGRVIFSFWLLFKIFFFLFILFCSIIFIYPWFIVFPKFEDSCLPLIIFSHCPLLYCLALILFSSSRIFTRDILIQFSIATVFRVTSSVSFLVYSFSNFMYI